MKIFLDGITPETLKDYVFISRLVPAMEKIGATVQYEITNADVILSCNQKCFEHKNSSLPKAIRPVFMHPHDSPEAMATNKLMTNMYKHADLIIWQSRWFKNVHRKLTGFDSRSGVVINNGIDPNVFIGAKNPYTGKNNIVIAGGWIGGGKNHNRPRKRLDEMLALAEEYVKTRDATFWVIGECVRSVKNDRIKFIGKLPFSEMTGYLKHATVMLNLSWFDNCPNAVVEALVAGIQVVCNNESGAAEMVNGIGGIVVPIDPPIDRFMKKRTSPEFEIRPVMEALDKVIAFPCTISTPNLFIDSVALRYKEVLEVLINGDY